MTKDDHPNICTHDYQHIVQNIDDLSDNTQQNNLYSSEESASSFTDNTDMHCDYSISNHTQIQKMQMTPTRTLHQNTRLYIHNKNTHTETHLAMHTYSIMTLTIKTCSHLKTNIQHYYNKNYKTHTGIYMTQ